MGQIFKHPQAAIILRTPVFQRIWIVAGGQSGVDRAAIDFALERNLPVRGWCPSDRTCEDGSIAAHYPMQESSGIEPALRTELNAFDSDGTLILSFAGVSDGTVLTEECAANFAKPTLKFDIEERPRMEDARMFREWVKQNSIKILNIAGSRESFKPGKIYNGAKVWLEYIFCD